MSSTKPYQNGCEKAFGDYVRAHTVKIGVVGFVLAIIQVDCEYSLIFIFYKNIFYS